MQAFCRQFGVSYCKLKPLGITDTEEVGGSKPLVPTI